MKGPRVVVALFALGALGAACRAPRGPLARPEPAVGESIVVAGERIAIGTPVVLWYEEPRYNAYATEPRFQDEGPAGLRYQPGRSVTDPDLARALEAEAPGLPRLRGLVDQFVLHYDVCGTSRRCFEVLQDLRGLSVHFLLDVDGTLYQTLDLREQAWHARQANPRSVGIEIAQIGAYPPDASEPLARHYVTEDGGVRLAVAEQPAAAGIRRAAFSGRPARPSKLTGAIHGRVYEQYDFTPEQYAALVKLAAGLVRTFPLIAPDAPRALDGSVRTDVLSDEEFARYRGILGHCHVSEAKIDPGPAFDWEGFLTAVRAELGAVELD